MNARKNAIEAMRAFHANFKKDKVNMDLVEDSIKKLSETDRNFMLVTSQMPNVRNVYPVSSKLSSKYSLADLVAAYRWYLAECHTSSADTAVMDAIDDFYN